MEALELQVLAPLNQEFSLTAQDDVGFMVQLEGPIVQSIYDTAILSWWMSFQVPLPLLSRPPQYSSPLKDADFVFGDAHQDVAALGDLDLMAERTRQRLVLHPSLTNTGPSNGDPSSDSEVGSSKGCASRPFRPVLVHQPHAPFPIAMVNRTPRGRKLRPWTRR